jgi:glycerophosphoryl diester phosphodiesterase
VEAPDAMNACAVYAHRLGSEYGPESSRSALERSLAEDVGGLECDVCLSADGHVVAIHDPFLPISTDLEGWAHEKRADQLCDAHLLDRDGQPSAERPMRVDELLERVGDRLPLQLDVKAYADPFLAGSTAEAICDIAERHAARESVEVISFFATACVTAARRGFRNRIVTWSDYEPAALAEWSLEHGVTGISCEGFVLGPDFAAAMTGAGLGMSVGQVNRVEQAEKVLPFGPEILVSDRPAELTREIIALDSGQGP